MGHLLVSLLETDFFFLQGKDPVILLNDTIIETLFKK